MKKSMALVCVSVLLSSVAVFAAENIHCELYQGRYSNRKLIDSWDSDQAPASEFKFYSKFSVESLAVDGIWGVNISPTVDPVSKDRFTILIWDRNTGQSLVELDTDVNGPVDLAAYLPSHDFSISCTGK
jgi:hypothetical protein